MRTPRLIVTLILSAGIHALGLFGGLGASGDTQSTEASQEAPQETSANGDTGATCEGPTATSAQAVEEQGLQTLIDACDRMLVSCQGLLMSKGKARSDHIQLRGDVGRVEIVGSSATSSTSSRCLR
jgi:hypothetical protein